MANTDYTVASVGQLLGAKPPKRSTPREDIYFANMRSTDQLNKERSNLKRMDNVRKVKYTESAVLPGEAQSSNDDTSFLIDDAKADSAVDIPSISEPDGCAKPTATIVYLPKIHQWRLAREPLPKLSMYNLSQSGTVSRSCSKRSKSSKALEVPAIYFSPNTLNCSSTSLSSPKNSPPVVRQHDQSKLSLSPTQLDRMNIAFAQSRLVQVHARKHYYDDIPDDMTVVSETSPSSLTENSGLYSHSNRQFVVKPPSPGEDKKTTGAPATQVPIFDNIALTDPNVVGAPIRFISTEFEVGANMLKVGQCSFLNIPYGTESDSNIRIEPPGDLYPNCRIKLQIVVAMLDRKTGRKAYNTTAEIDITEQVQGAAIAELSRSCDVPVSFIELTAIPTQGPASPDIDWCALADELQASCEVSDRVDNAIACFADLTAFDVTSETSHLLKLIDDIKAAHSDILVARALSFHPDGRPWKIRIPWVSQHLHNDIRCKNGSCTNAGRELRDEVLAEIGNELVGRGNSFNRSISEGRTVRVVPMSEGLGSVGARAWACLIRSE